MDIGKLSSGYSAEIDQVSETEWTKILLRFRDATINQTWRFGAVLTGENNLSHLILKRDNEVVAAAQIRIVTLPVVRVGIAYLAWGPIWRMKNRESDPEGLRQMVRTLREEYAARRGLLLKVLPNEWGCDSNAEAVRAIFEDEGFKWNLSPGRTLLVDLTPSLEVLRRGLRRRWRNYLKQAENSGMRIREGTGDRLFEKFTGIYKEMRARKKYYDGIDIEKYRAIQRGSPDILKQRIILCELDGELIAGAVFSAIGDTTTEILKATSNNGLKYRASYLVQWRMIEWAKQHGHRIYDLSSIDPEKAPGPYQFKAGVCGKNGKEARRIGEFIACESVVSSLVVKYGLPVIRSARWLKAKIEATG